MSGTIRTGKLGAAALVLAVCLASAAGAQTGYFGTASVNINPLTPVMLSGYAGRASGPESTVVAQNIKAQAAAFGMGPGTSLLIAVDCTGVPDNVVDPLSARLSADHGIDREHIVVTSTHSHNCPHVTGYLSNLFNPPLTASQQAHVDQYTADLFDWLEQVACSALGNRTPGHLMSWGNGSVGFGRNRRGTSIAPNDHDLPVMRVTDGAGVTKAIITSYATHATTLANNSVSGDWPGYARERIEAAYPGALALVMIGAGVDSNPSPAGNTSAALNHGQAIATEVQRLINDNLLTPVAGDISAFHSELSLDYATQLAPGDPGSARLAPSPGSALYGVTSWTLGDELAMVFMEGEVTVDYSLRLKAELGDRVWVNGYSNDVQGYIPSERLLYEGGYEPDESTFYYALPGRFAHGLEDKIVGAVHDQLLDFSGLGDRLRLVVDYATGEASLANLGDEVVAIDGYTIHAPTGNLNPANSAWQSLQDQGLPGWDQADNSGPFRLTEFKTSGTTVFNPGASILLGAPIMLTPPAQFGDDVKGMEIELEYSVPGEGAIAGLVTGKFSSEPINNLVLTVDPETGAASIHNASPYFDASIAAFTITSADGDLLSTNGNWSSLQDQGLAGWDEADNSNAFRLTEFNPTGSMLLAGSETLLNLGNPIDVTGGAPSLAALDFEFLLGSGVTMDGVVVLGKLPDFENEGDFDTDGDVDGADFLVWQRTLGTVAIPIGSGADGNANGVIDGGDLAVWKLGQGANGSVANLAVPEPTAPTVTMAVVVAAIIAYRTTAPSGF